jgi:hypothetical protein
MQWNPGSNKPICGTPGWIRTYNQQILSLPALPISVQGHKYFCEDIRSNNTTRVTFSSLFVPRCVLCYGTRYVRQHLLRITILHRCQQSTTLYQQFIKQDDVVSPGIEPLFQLRCPLARPPRLLAGKSVCCSHPITWYLQADSNPQPPASKASRTTN